VGGAMWPLLRFVGACSAGVSIASAPLHAQARLDQSQSLTSTPRPTPIPRPTPTPPSQEPQLHVDPGMHTAPIWRIGVDESCTLLATGSDDKTVRLWGLPEGKLIYTLRPPIGPGENGKVHAVAMAPDGRWVAVFKTPVSLVGADYQRTP
jgi:WD40 repeat protein